MDPLGWMPLGLQNNFNRGAVASIMGGAAAVISDIAGVKGVRRNVPPADEHTETDDHAEKNIFCSPNKSNIVVLSEWSGIDFRGIDFHTLLSHTCHGQAVAHEPRDASKLRREVP